MSAINESLVDTGDLDELIRQVDRLQSADDWDLILDLRARCLKALERGKQLWPIASLCEYRVALHGPADLAASLVVEGGGRFAPGPLAEVAASRNTWDDLAPTLPEGPLRTVVAHERALRGDEIDLAQIILEPEVPLQVFEWEPAYTLASYDDERVEVPVPPLSGLEGAMEVTRQEKIARIADPDVESAFREVVRPWTADSNGVAGFCAVEGEAQGAIAGLGHRQVRLATLTASEALCYLAWTGASGGAHGRRRGAATGRLNAWWTATAVTGIEDWPPKPDDLAAAMADLRWFRWDLDEPQTGWRFRVAVEDQADGLAWAFEATDHHAG